MKNIIFTICLKTVRRNLSVKINSALFNTELTVLNIKLLLLWLLLLHHWSENLICQLLLSILHVSFPERTSTCPICFLVSCPRTINQSAVYYLIWQVSLNNLEKHSYFKNFFFSDFIKSSFWDKPFSWASTCASA